MALLATLWLLAALSAVAGAALVTARVERGALLNDLALTRGRWAAEGCLAVLQARLDRDSTLSDVDSTDLGGGTWCRAKVGNADARIALDRVSSEMLERLLGDPHLAAAYFDWTDPDDDVRPGGAESAWYRSVGRPVPRNGPVTDVEELYLIAGFDSAIVERLRPLVTVHGSGRIAVNAAPAEVLAVVPGFDPPVVAIVLAQRGAGRPYHGLDDLLRSLPPSLRAPLAERYAELSGRLSFGTERVLIRLEGHTSGADLFSSPEVTGLIAGRRLSIGAWEGL